MAAVLVIEQPGKRTLPLIRGLTAAVAILLFFSSGSFAKPPEKRIRGVAGEQRLRPIPPGVSSSASRIFRRHARASQAPSSARPDTEVVRTAHRALWYFVRASRRGDASAERTVLHEAAAQVAAMGPASKRKPSLQKEFGRLRSELQAIVNAATPSEEVEKARALLAQLDAAGMQRHHANRAARPGSLQFIRNGSNQ